jgi:hypothetical protein
MFESVKKVEILQVELISSSAIYKQPSKTVVVTGGMRI